MLSHQILCLASLILTASATCYFPDGTVSGLDVACESSATDSFCCFSNQACLSNGLCMTGKSGACPNFCLDQKTLGNVMYSCNQTHGDRYCCNNDCSCDENGRNEVVSFTGKPYTLTVIGQTGTYPNPSATRTSSSSSGSSATTTSKSASRASATATSTSHASNSSGSSNSVAIGVGVGVGVGCALIFGLGAFLFFRRRARARQSQQPISDKADYLPGYNDGQTHPLQPTKLGVGQNAYQPYRDAPASGIVSELGTERAQGMHELSGENDVPRELPGHEVR